MPTATTTKTSTRKKCAKCGSRKSTNSFGVQKRPGGREVLKSRCRPCLAEDRREASANKKAAAAKNAKKARKS